MTDKIVFDHNNKPIGIYCGCYLFQDRNLQSFSDGLTLTNKELINIKEKLKKQSNMEFCYKCYNKGNLLYISELDAVIV